MMNNSRQSHKGLPVPTRDMSYRWLERNTKWILPYFSMTDTADNTHCLLDEASLSDRCILSLPFNNLGSKEVEGHSWRRDVSIPPSFHRSMTSLLDMYELWVISTLFVTICIVLQGYPEGVYYG